MVQINSGHELCVRNKEFFWLCKSWNTLGSEAILLFFAGQAGDSGRPGRVALHLKITYVTRLNGILSAGLYFGQTKLFILQSPPPFRKVIFSPLLATRRFPTLILLFLPYLFPTLHLFYPFTSHFLSFSFPFLPFFPLSFMFFPICHL